MKGLSQAWAFTVPLLDPPALLIQVSDNREPEVVIAQPAVRWFECFEFHSAYLELKLMGLMPIPRPMFIVSLVIVKPPPRPKASEPDCRPPDEHKMRQLVILLS